jgi:predicted AAA+ superfamily ATPase
MFDRILKLEEIKNDTVFLWGARQTGKSTLLKKTFPDSPHGASLRLVPNQIHPWPVPMYH